MKTTALALALLTSVTPAAAPLAGLAAVGNAAVASATAGTAAARTTAVATGPTVSSTSLWVSAARAVQTGTDGDLTLWTVERASVNRTMKDKTGHLYATRSPMVCPAGSQPLDLDLPFDASCWSAEGTSIVVEGEQLTVSGDDQLGTITVTGAVQEMEQYSEEPPTPGTVSLTFTATGPREAYADSWGEYSSSGWTRSVTTSGSAGSIQLDGAAGEASWRTDISPKITPTSMTEVSARHTSLTSEEVLDQVVWTQVGIDATSWVTKDDRAEDFTGSIVVWTCEPGVHPLEDAWVDDQPPCPSESYDIEGVVGAIEVTGSKKLDTVSVTGTALVDGEEALVDLTFTGVGTISKEKSEDQGISGPVLSRGATMSGFVGELWFDGEQADLRSWKQAGNLGG